VGAFVPVLWLASSTGRAAHCRGGHSDLGGSPSASRRRRVGGGSCCCFRLRFTHREIAGGLGAQLLCLAALVLLAKRTERPAWGWLWLTSGIVAAVILPSFFQAVPFLPYQAPSLLLCILLVLLAWIGIDARPAVALGTYYLIVSLSALLGNAAMGIGNWFSDPAVLVAAALAGLAAWRLRRQSVQGPGGRPASRISN
jgi:hypothetical protein